MKRPERYFNQKTQTNEEQAPKRRASVEKKKFAKDKILLEKKDD
jgi:hypothetical protein